MKFWVSGSFLSSFTMLLHSFLSSILSGKISIAFEPLFPFKSVMLQSLVSLKQYFNFQKSDYDVSRLYFLIVYSLHYSPSHWTCKFMAFMIFWQFLVIKYSNNFCALLVLSGTPMTWIYSSMNWVWPWNTATRVRRK